MDEEGESKVDNFLSATQLLKIKGIGNVAWEDWQQSEITLPKTGKKYFEPTGSWLQEMQLENGLKNRKRVIEIERVERHSQLAIAEWLPGIQKARVTKKSGQKWENFGHEEKSQLYLLPEEALILLEMSCLELTWNGMPLSIQQAYEILINSENSKCSLDEYRVYSQLIRCGYKLQRIRGKPATDNKSSNATKRIIMNIDGLWTPNTSPTKDVEVSEINDSSSKFSSEQENSNTKEKIDQAENDTSTKAQKLGIILEETVLGNIKIVKDSSVKNQVQKWPGTRIQRNVKLMPKRNDMKNISNKSNLDSTNQSLSKTTPEKRKSTDYYDSIEEASPAKKPRPEIIELSDDEVEEIPRPMSRMEILNTMPNLAGSRDEFLIAEIPRAYLPLGIKPVKDIYRFDRRRLLNLTETDRHLRVNPQEQASNNSSNNGISHNATSSHFYSQRSGNSSQCQSITAYGSNNGFSIRGMRCQRTANGSYIQQNVSHNTIHSPFSGSTIYQSVNFVMEVMGNMVMRSYRQQQFQQTTYCHNLQVFQQPRFSYAQQRYSPYGVNYFCPPNQRQYYGRGQQSAYSPAYKSKGGYRLGGYNSSNNGDTSQRASQDELPNQPAFSKRPGVQSWSELKKRWREESTITIEDEEPTQLDSENNNEVQVVETIKPLFDSKGMSNLSEVYEKLRIIKSVTDRTVRSRKIDYFLSYDVYPINQHFKKSAPGTPICRLFVVNAQKDSSLDTSKLQRLQQESKEVPVVVAFVSRSCISYIQPGVVLLPNLS